MKNLILTIILTALCSFAAYGQQTHPFAKRYVLKGDGQTDDTIALNAWGKGRPVLYHGRRLGRVLQNGRFVITWRVDFRKRGLIVRNNIFLHKYEGYDSMDIVGYGRHVRHSHNQVTSYIGLINWEKMRELFKIIGPLVIYSIGTHPH